MLRPRAAALAICDSAINPAMCNQATGAWRGRMLVSPCAYPPVDMRVCTDRPGRPQPHAHSQIVAIGFEFQLQPAAEIPLPAPFPTLAALGLGLEFRAPRMGFGVISGVGPAGGLYEEEVGSCFPPVSLFHMGTNLDGLAHGYSASGYELITHHASIRAVEPPTILPN